MSIKKPTISVIIPVYNSEAILPHLMERLDAQLNSLCLKYEVIFVDDNSRDNSWQVIQELSNQYTYIQAYQLTRNYGQHNALLCAIRRAKYDLIVTMDDDLQHPPEEIPKLLQELNKGFDVIYGRPIKDRHNLWRNLASRMTKIVLQKAMSAETASNISAFRIFRTTCREAFINYHGSFLSIDVLLTWGTTRFSTVEVKHQPRYEGKSNYTFRKLLNHAFNMVTGFSAVPLKLASWIGFIFTVFGLIILAYVIVKFFITRGRVPGFTFLASIISLFSGAMLFSLGIFGEYLARIHFGLLEQPTYLIRKSINAQKEMEKT